jgi:hypothetical protein
MVERGGRARAHVIPFSGAADIRPHVLDAVKAQTKLYTDGWGAYQTMAGTYEHHWVDHNADEYLPRFGARSDDRGFLVGDETRTRRRLLLGLAQVVAVVRGEYIFHYNYRTSLGGIDPFRVLRARAALPTT